jgi:hypothetical protein
MTASFASSAGWPRRTPAIEIQERSLAAVPAPVPVPSVINSTTIPIP